MKELSEVLAELAVTRPVVALVTGAAKQVAILPDEAAPNLIKINIQGSVRSCWDLFVAVATKSDEQV